MYVHGVAGGGVVVDDAARGDAVDDDLSAEAPNARVAVADDGGR